MSSNQMPDAQSVESIYQSILNYAYSSLSWTRHISVYPKLGLLQIVFNVQKLQVACTICMSCDVAISEV